jgi:hypothetical protein
VPLTYSTALRIEEFLGEYAITPEDEAEPEAAARRLWAAAELSEGAEGPDFTFAELVEYVGSAPCEPSDCADCSARGLCCG